jgi:predicted nucleotidyltransferase
MTDSPSPHFDTSLWEETLEAEARRREQERLRILAQARDQLFQYFQNKRVRAVYLTGSLLREGHFYPFSDVDIAVEGLQEDYFAVMAQLEDLLDHEVELLELETCPFSDTIRQKGVRIL